MSCLLKPSGADQNCVELFQAPDAAADSALAEKVAQLRDELTDCKTELEACRQQVQMAEQDKAAGVEAVNVEHHKQQVLIDDIQRLRQQLENSQQAAEVRADARDRLSWC